MLETPVADQTKAEALVKRGEGSIFFRIVEQFEYIAISIGLSLFLFVLILLCLPDLPPNVIIAILLFLVIGMSTCSIFALRKLRSRHNTELKTIYSELFIEGLEENQILWLVSKRFLYIRLPKRPNDHKKREVIKFKDELWKLDNVLGD